MTITYDIAIDTNQDGSFDFDSITDDVLLLKWRLGMHNPDDRFAAPTVGEIHVRTVYRSYDDLPPGLSVRIQSTRFDTVTHLIAQIDRIEPTLGIYGDDRAIIYLRGRGQELEQQMIRLPALVNVTADVALTQILEQTQFRRTALNQTIVIDRTPYNTIDLHNIHAPTAMTMTFDTGVSVFPYTGDTWSEGIRADRAIRQIVDSEGGYFFFKRAGDAVFYNRHHTLNNDPAESHIFFDDMDALDYDYGGALVNAVDVQVTPRSIGAANSLLWSLSGVMELQPQTTRTIQARYTQNSRPIGALHVTPPQTGVHVVANSRDDGLGDDLSDTIQVRLVEVGFGAATLELINPTINRVYVQTLDLRGTPLIVGDSLIVNERDDLSISTYGMYRRAYRLPMLTELDEAAALAQYDLLRFSEPRGIVQMVYLSTQNFPDVARELTLFDAVQIRETGVDHDRWYRIMGEEHEVDKGGTRHRVTWLLAPDDDDLFFLVDTHAVNSDEIPLPR